ncbi:uncharacterized protein F4822DRAFT_136324 [Hypoxylon trugodes]|uniref:uncharacterized protein n=1 Tax=Hypoxylon trugodes TaxID=326681 RepID=UPI00219943C5|nr:uncharacterized protein F4822DRAFT_136324 [Hypoxylon trugodes]KAI1392647.1 hypothetical protein F4822DRAFT_136324 [Hypoxylon trugodes]
MSGWSHEPNKSIHVAGKDWTDEVLFLCRIPGFDLEPHYYDRGIPGQYNACHAEKQLAAYFIHKHLFLEHELAGPEESESGVELSLSRLTIGNQQNRNKEGWTENIGKGLQTYGEYPQKKPWRVPLY